MLEQLSFLKDEDEHMPGSGFHAAADGTAAVATPQDVSGSSSDANNGTDLAPGIVKVPPPTKQSGRGALGGLPKVSSERETLPDLPKSVSLSFTKDAEPPSDLEQLPIPSCDNDNSFTDHKRFLSVQSRTLSCVPSFVDPETHWEDIMEHEATLMNELRNLQWVCTPPPEGISLWASGAL